MSEEDHLGAEPLILPYTGGRPVAPVHLDVVGSTQVVYAVLRPDLAVSEIAEQWRAALELSAGAGVLAQLATSSGPDAELWGPCERITPTVRHELNGQIDPQTAIGGLLLGRDFLDSVVLAYVGPAQRVAIFQRQA